MAFTMISNTPPKWGPLGGLKFQLMLWPFRKSCVLLMISGKSTDLTHSSRSLFIFTNDVWLSEVIVSGTPRMSTKRLIALKTSVVSMPPVGSKWTALTAMHVRTRT